jgi:C1A family cysteine protease
MSKEFYQKANKIKRYGWKRSLPDFRDFMYSPPHSLTAPPPIVDLRPGCPSVYDQENLGSCTAQAVGGLAEFLMKKQGKPAFTPSRLFIYYNERVLEGTVNEDAGATIRSGFKVVNKLGNPHEALWWYDISKFRTRPNKKVYTDGLNHQILRYTRVNHADLYAMRACLANGFPIVGGFAVFQSFESSTVTRTGIVPMPKRSERMLGGHAIMVVGYDDTKQMFIVRNSWGTGWGIKGYCMMPYLYLTNTQLADDFWTGTFIE